jgi:hypothetical protein
MGAPPTVIRPPNNPAPIQFAFVSPLCSVVLADIRQINNFTLNPIDPYYCRVTFHDSSDSCLAYLVCGEIAFIGCLGVAYTRKCHHRNHGSQAKYSLCVDHHDLPF